MNLADKRKIALLKKCLYFGKYEYAMMIVDNLMHQAQTQNEPELLRELSVAYHVMNKNRESLGCIKRAFEIEKSVENLQYLAIANESCRNYEDAAIEYEEILKYKDNENIYYECIDAYKKLNLPTESIRIAKEWVKKHNDANSYSVLAFEYMEIGMEKEAKETCAKLKEIATNNAVTINTIGFLYETIYNDYPTAKEYFLKAAKMGLLDAYYNLGVCCKQSEDFVNAEKYLKRLINLNAKSTMDYNYTLGTVYFAQRKLAQGYKYYQKRKNTKNITYRNRNYLWDGKDYPDKVLYVQAEQGYGDNIQFIRYVSLAAKKFKKVIYATYDNLVELFKESFPAEKYPNIEIVPLSEIVRYNKFALLMDLPYLLHMNFYNIPAKEQYLISNRHKQENFRLNYFNNNKIKIGLNWRAKGMGLRDAVYRTIDAPYYFKNIMDLDNVEYYSFQMGDIFNMLDKYPKIIDLAPNFNTFADTAAALKNIDILVTVDTALAHLAGALGIKTYLLLCFAPDWRWFENDKKTEWYPNVTIIKQHDRRTWDDVAEVLTKSLKQDVEKMNTGSSVKRTEDE